MYKAYIEPDLQTAHLRIYNTFNPFSGFMNATYILKSNKAITKQAIKSCLKVGSSAPELPNSFQIQDGNQSIDEKPESQYSSSLTSLGTFFLAKMWRCTSHILAFFWVKSGSEETTVGQRWRICLRECGLYRQSLGRFKYLLSVNGGHKSDYFPTEQQL